MHSLIKFIPTQKFLDCFLSGKLYMNTLDYYWANGFDDQKDIFEGVVATVPVKDLQGFPTDFQSAQACDYRFRAEGYRYCNVMCFYKLRYEIQGSFIHYSYDKKMSKFGEYVVFIANESEFLRRVHRAAEEKGYKYLCGDVRYHELKKDGNPTKEGYQMILKAGDHLFDISELEHRGYHIQKRDCFDKSTRYRNQSEWRIALYRSLKDTQACYLEVGDLSRIVSWFTADQLEAEIDKNMNRFNCVNDFEGWYGNITRKGMKELFCNLGDNKASMFATIG